jgi:predicted PolB exonuclease-like 3'-5' exonuclease
MKELFHIDIETAGNYPDYNTFLLSDERGAKLFEKKYHKMMWEDKYGDIHSAYKENAGIITTYGRIVCISCGYIDSNGVNRISSFYGDNELEIVNNFSEAIKKVEKKAFDICGFRVLYFDIPWVLHKLTKYGIRPADILQTIDKKPWDMRVVDMSDDWRGKFAWAYSFDELAYELGVESPKAKFDGSQVHDAFWRGDIDSIKEYCEKDVEVSIEVSKKLYI